MLGKALEAKSIPLFLHGDGVEYQNRDSMMVWSWGCMLGDQSSLEKHMLLATFPKSCTTKETWPSIWKVLRWSFDALGKGLHPTHDSDGKPLEKGSPLFGKAGKPLHPNGYRAMCLQCRGTMSSTAIIWDCPIGHPITHVGNVLERTLLIVIPA